MAVCAITLAELSAGPSAARTADERGRRQDRLQRTEAVFDLIPFDLEAARAYGRVHAAVLASGRQPQGRFADLLIASTALASDLPLLTRNPDEFAGLDQLVDISAV